MAIASILPETGLFPGLSEKGLLPEYTERIGSFLDIHNKDTRSHSAYVAESSEGSVVGHLALHWRPSLFLPAPEGNVSEIFVTQRRRNRGTGRKLLDVAGTEGYRKLHQETLNVQPALRN